MNDDYIKIKDKEHISFEKFNEILEDAVERALFSRDMSYMQEILDFEDRINNSVSEWTNCFKERTKLLSEIIEKLMLKINDMSKDIERQILNELMGTDGELDMGPYENHRLH